jgi:SAM-dependent methyltransferase
MDTGKTEWFEEESFWEHYAPVMFESERWAEAPAVVDGIDLMYRSAQSNGIGSQDPSGKVLHVLDLCCGMGRISVELARRGMSVCGVDLCSHISNWLVSMPRIQP